MHQHCEFPSSRGEEQHRASSSSPSPTVWALVPLPVLPSVPQWVMNCLPALGAGPVPAAQDLGLPRLPSILHCFTLSCSGLPSLGQSVPVSFCMSWAV